MSHKVKRCCKLIWLYLLLILIYIVAPKLILVLTWMPFYLPIEQCTCDEKLWCLLSANSYNSSFRTLPHPVAHSNAPAMAALLINHHAINAGLLSSSTWLMSVAFGPQLIVIKPGPEDDALSTPSFRSKALWTFQRQLDGDFPKGSWLS